MTKEQAEAILSLSIQTEWKVFTDFLKDEIQLREDIALQPGTEYLDTETARRERITYQSMIDLPEMAMQIRKDSQNDRT